MPLIQLIVLLVVVGVLMWLVNNKIPMDGTIKQIINVVVIVVVVLFVLSLFFNLGSLNMFRIGKH